jgi:uncharacterized OsmC-like protein
MKIIARVRNSKSNHQVALRTDEVDRSIVIPPKSTGFGSSVNGGELLFLALATCYCNDVYREAAKRRVSVKSVEVEVEGNFGGEGEPARNVMYRAKVAAQAGEREIFELMRAADQAAEIQNTLRLGMPVTLSVTEAISV